ncbi:hypothetical protein PNP85_05950 [Halobacterium salinarum]|uniref:Uncharacterized protein n=1 Tax=Natrinema pellirubrum (strain DSM 15624 / CIP 106293 / JCM 10476 / NCIMB 786 / 157) TaxID=797303 RepID=L9YDN0_NATP1|nr:MULTISPECIES: hypothetical protein [Halobacteria]ELY72194.1 hypothetical protein C488_15532 [Natrinema pellirubrum DSM 15624]MDL0139044.1 hypothetical protein [Halobacterium salinarum]
MELKLPSGWSQRPDEEQQRSALVEFQCAPSTTTTFVVSLLQRSADAEEYTLQLSTINRTAATHIRHDYSLEEYRTQDAALTAAESLITSLDTRFRDGAISPADPTLEEIDEILQEATESHRFPRIRRFFRRLG